MVVSGGCDSRFVRVGCGDSCGPRIAGVDEGRTSAAVGIKKKKRRERKKRRRELFSSGDYVAHSGNYKTILLVYFFLL